MLMTLMTAKGMFSRYGNSAPQQIEHVAEKKTFEPAPMRRLQPNNFQDNTGEPTPWCVA